MPAEQERSENKRKHNINMNMKKKIMEPHQMKKTLKMKVLINV
jgi:hypothetical protein